MMPLAGWDGPDCITDGIYRYSKCVSWIRLYIDVIDEPIESVEDLAAYLERCFS